MQYLTELWRDFVLVFPHIVTLEVGRYVVTAALFSLIIWAFWRAHFATRKIQARVAGTKDYAREALASLRTALIFALTGFGMYLAHKAGWLTIYGDFSVRGPIYFAVTLLAMIVAQDAYFYWTHRLMHYRRLFRTFHWTHHKSKTPTPWTAYAFDAPEAMVHVAFVPIWVAIVPMHDMAIYAFVTWQIVRNVMGHAGVEMFPVSGKPSRLFGWFNATTHHDLHHQDGRSNYGLYFTWWDRLMGTENAEYQARVAEIAERARRPHQTRGVAAKAAVIAIAALASATLPSDSQAQAVSGITGNWATRGFGSIVRFAPCANAAQTMCGRIVWLWEPNDASGRPRVDAHNPDRALRTRSLIGIEIVRGLQETQSGVWTNGQLYNPDDGRTYTGTVRLQRGMLELRGCAMSIFCDAQIWRKPEDILAQVRGL